MKTLEEVQAQLLSGEFDFSEHAFWRAVERNISDAEIMEAGQGVMLVEEYEDHKYGPSGLLLGFTITRRPLHLLVSLSDTPVLRIVTLYEPDPDLWEDYATRRQ